MGVCVGGSHLQQPLQHVVSETVAQPAQPAGIGGDERLEQHSWITVWTVIGGVLGLLWFFRSTR